MAKRFRSGSKDEVLLKMARCAIRDQETLIDALTPQFSKPDEATAQAIAQCQDWLADFRRIARQIQRGTKGYNHA